VKIYLKFCRSILVCDIIPIHVNNSQLTSSSINILLTVRMYRLQSILIHPPANKRLGKIIQFRMNKHIRKFQIIKNNQLHQHGQFFYKLSGT